MRLQSWLIGLQRIALDGASVPSRSVPLGSGSSATLDALAAMPESDLVVYVSQDGHSDALDAAASSSSISESGLDDCPRVDGFFV